MKAEDVRESLREFRNPEKAAFFPRFFKTGPGQYGEGDKFLGVVVPDQRKVARRYKTLDRKQLKELLQDPYHECRLTALLILVLQYQKAKEPAQRKSICNFYLDNLECVNNWDLVDSSAHKILGPWLRETGDRTLLYELADRDHLWSQRVAIIATMHFLKFDEFEDTLALCERFLDHPHDLIHKACGWLLREIGKRDLELLRTFLNKFHKRMARTMLRYAIEKMSREERTQWLKK